MHADLFNAAANACVICFNAAANACMCDHDLFNAAANACMICMLNAANACMICLMQQLMLLNAAANAGM